MCCVAGPSCAERNLRCLRSLGGEKNERGVCGKYVSKDGSTEEPEEMNAGAVAIVELERS